MIVTERYVGYPIKPKHIDAEQPCFRPIPWDVPGDAASIVRYCQSQGDWTPFAKEEFFVFCRDRRLPLPNLDDFVRNECLRLGQDRRYRVTHEFIVACFKAAPVTERDSKSLVERALDPFEGYAGEYIVEFDPRTALDRIPRKPYEIEVHGHEVRVLFGRIQPTMPGFHFFSKSCDFAYTLSNIRKIKDSEGNVLWKNPDLQ